MTAEQQPEQLSDEQKEEQEDLELDEEQTDEVKGGAIKVRGTPDQESGRRAW